MRIAFLVIASNDPLHESDLLAQRNTWAKSAPENITVISLRGWENDYFLYSGSTLFVPCPEEYSLILQKTILGTEYLVRNLDFDILIRSNVSTYFDIPKLTAELDRPKYSRDFVGGYFDRTSQGYFNRTSWFEYISGTAIFMSLGAARELSTLRWDDYLGVADDVAIDNFFQKKGFRRIRMARNNLGSTHIFLPTFHTRAKSSTDNALASKRMFLLYGYFNAATKMARVESYFRILCLEFSAFFQQPESFYLFLAKNRVVFMSFLRMKKESLWLKFIQY